MSDTGTEVSGRIDGITCGAAERHTDGHDEHGYRERSGASEAEVGSVAFSGEGHDDEHQHAGADNLADEIAPVIADCRDGAEATQLGGLVFSSIEVIFIEHPYQPAADYTAKNLGDNVAGHVSPGE